MRADRHHLAHRADDGVTLVELLVVLVIVAILMAIATVTFLSHKQKALGSRAKTHARMAAQVVESCAAGHIPPSYIECSDIERLAEEDESIGALITEGGEPQSELTTPQGPEDLECSPTPGRVCVAVGDGAFVVSSAVDASDLPSLPGAPVASPEDGKGDGGAAGSGSPAAPAVFTIAVSPDGDRTRTCEPANSPYGCNGGRW